MNTPNQKLWLLLGLFGTLLLVYGFFFTEWFRPAPIEIVSQVRFAIQPPHTGRTIKKTVAPGQPGQTNHATSLVQIVRPFELIEAPDKGKIDQAPGGSANVTFGLDQPYQLTHVRVEDLPADGTPPKVLWELKGKSHPTRAFLYGRPLEGLLPCGVETNAEPLIAGAPYRLVLEAGRRRGTNHFTTAALRVPQ